MTEPQPNLFGRPRGVRRAAAVTLAAYLVAALGPSLPTPAPAAPPAEPPPSCQDSPCGCCCAASGGKCCCCGPDNPDANSPKPTAAAVGCQCGHPDPALLLALPPALPPARPTGW